MPKYAIASQLFHIEPSKSVKLLLIFLHLLALVACWSNSMPIQYRMVLSVLVVSLLFKSIRYRNASVIQLRYTSNSWEICKEQAIGFVTATLLGSTTITDWAIFLHFKTSTLASGTLLIAKDSLTAERYRCLRVMLKLSEFRF